jgi:hypothetical protein
MAHPAVMLIVESIFKPRISWAGFRALCVQETFRWTTYMKLRTKRNLIAMQCGALDAAKYHRFAACACMDGEWDLAKVFHDAAVSDRTQHFSKEAAELEGVKGYSPDKSTQFDSRRNEGTEYVHRIRARSDGGWRRQCRGSIQQS